MGVLKLARGAALTAYLNASRSRGGRVVLVPGDPAATGWLRALLDAPLQERPDSDALAVFTVSEDADVAPVAAGLGERADSGGRSLAVIFGSPQRRAATERALRAVPGVELSSIVHVARPDSDGERPVLEGLIRQLGDQAPAAARQNAALRPAIGAHVVSRAATMAGLLATGTTGRRAGMLALTTLQLQMLGTLLGAFDRPLNARRAGDVAAVVGSGFAWRLLGRGATAALPAPSVMLRGGIAYTATRVLGELTLRRLAAGKDLTDLRPATIKETLARLRPGVSASPTQEEAA